MQFLLPKGVRLQVRLSYGRIQVIEVEYPEGLHPIRPRDFVFRSFLFALLTNGKLCDTIREKRG